ncbi:MAG TPA: tol-pal system-associated acyl-CoA thioesterase [Steroidobacteraceae bacterium]|nr:tol-pal system-associated acyl-CoA thioesterase [Steroidobacteraceae bacterium]
MTAAFVWPVRTYWEDTDAGGIVYYANYLKFMERARTEWLRSIGIDQVSLKDEHGLMFVVVDVEAHYRKPARYGDQLQVTCKVRETTRASITLDQEVYRENVGGELLLDGRVRAACLDAQTYRPRPLPPQLWTQIKAGDR